MIVEIWNSMSWGDKLYLLYGLIVAAIVCKLCINKVRNSTKRQLDFISNAYKKGHMVVGKLTCLTIHGIGKPEYYQAEYMYNINDKNYFVTYTMKYSMTIDDRKDKMNADMLLLGIKPALILFYDEKNPKKVKCKLEVFTSREGIRQVKTPRKNVWRDIEKTWTESINLVQYFS